MTPIKISWLDEIRTSMRARLTKGRYVRTLLGIGPDEPIPYTLVTPGRSG